MENSEKESKENLVKCQIDLVPFLAEAFSTNPKVYKLIDEIYKKDKIKYYTSAKESKYYNHHIAREGSLIQEEYFKKALGIILSTTMDNTDQILDIVKTGWNYTYKYFQSHKKIVLENFLFNFIKKNRGLENIDDDYINSNVYIIFLLSIILEKEIDKTEWYYKIGGSFKLRMDHYEGENRISHSHINKEQMQLIRAMLLRFKKIGITNQLYGSNIIENEDLNNYSNAIEIMYDYERISLPSICNNIKLTDKDLEELVFLYILYNGNIRCKEDITDEIVVDAGKFIIATIHLKYFSKAYKSVKEHYFKNNKETMFIEVESINKENEKLKAENALLKESNAKFISECEAKDKEIARLKEELNKANENKQELNKLREFMFSLDTSSSNNEQEVDNANMSKIKEIKAVIIGGHNQWQAKMKEHIPNCRFITTDMLNFDTAILNSVESVFIYTSYLNHSMYYKVINEIRKKNIKFEYLAPNKNVNIVLKDILQKI